MDILTNYNWTDFIGNIGIVFIISAYIGLTTQRLSSTSKLYLILNAGGAALILFSLFFAFNLSAFLIEAIWLIVSLYGLLRLVTKT
ncbi:CBU_0592 family membrane protein [Robiginitomaculum antarcticum]|uniref:CBU_0592 family membrane protein n=1 Tax=Robiginitomaculum antarcticum TaxID=437507 RepID=UPI0003716437|nr:hypothetical protein [Robiginitomaculum antarcticum]